MWGCRYDQRYGAQGFSEARPIFTTGVSLVSAEARPTYAADKTYYNFKNDGLDSQLTASTVRPYFDGLCRQIVIAQP